MGYKRKSLQFLSRTASEPNPRGDTVRAHTIGSPRVRDSARSCMLYPPRSRCKFLRVADCFSMSRIVFIALSYFTIASAGLFSSCAASLVSTASIDSTRKYQFIEGLGGATAFYAGWITAHPYKQEIYSNAFAGLNISMLRLGDWYRYQTPLMGFDSAATEIVSNANRVLGHTHLSAHRPSRTGGGIQTVTGR